VTQLVTGEAVALDLNLAALPSRAVARAIDALAQALLLVLLSYGATITITSDAAAAAAGVAILVVVGVGYPVAFETFLRGRTPGKVVMGLRVVRDDGGPIAFRQAFTRGMTVVVDVITTFVVSVVCMLVSDRSKRLGDLVAGTVVVQERVAIPQVQPALMPPQLAGWAQGLELSGLSDELALSVRQFVSRAQALNPAARDDLGNRLVAAVAAVTAPPPPPGTPGWAYLSAVLAERRRRDSARLAAVGGWGASPAAPGARAAQPSYVAPPSYAPPPSYAAHAPAPDRPAQTDGFALPN
jgi:uncharacterized RDD family membrane protein YckC